MEKRWGRGRRRRWGVGLGVPAVLAVLAVLPSCSTVPAPLIERHLGYTDALAAGAAFPEPAWEGVPPEGCRASTGVARSGGLLFALHCSGAGRARSSHEAYVGMRLKNGWTVKDTHVSVLQRASGQFDLEEPPRGSDSARLAARLSADPGGEVLIEVDVTVQGPKGTDCYR
jgi:hypothetical protein